MTTLTITPNWKNKSARFKGTIAAGEHVAVSIANDDGSGSAYISSTTNLRLRVVDERGRTLAQFPMPPEEGETPDEWDSDLTPLSCELDLNTVQMLMAVPPAANVPLLFVLDDYEGKTLFFKDFCEVTHWPRRVGEEEPTNLDDYKDIIAEFREDIYGEGGFEDRVESAEERAASSASAATAAAESASGSQTSAANSASAAQTAAQAAAASATAAQTAAESINEPTGDFTKEGVAADAKAVGDALDAKADAAATSAALLALDSTKADKSTTYTKTEVDAIVQALKTGSRQIVETLPASGQPMVIYMVPKSASQTNNAYDEYIWMAAGSWEKIGDTEIDLSGYYTKTATDALLAAKQDTISDLAAIRSGAAAGATAVQPESGKGLSTEDYTTAEQTKLAGIAAGAQVNVIETVKVNGTALSPSSKAVDITVPTIPTPVAPASATASGQFADALATKSELAAKVALEEFSSGSWAQGSSYSSGDIVFYDGFIYLCSSDVSPSSTPPSEDPTHWDQVAVDYLMFLKADRSDIPSPSSTTPSMDGTAAVGVSDDYARADHVHPSDTSKADASALRYAMPESVALVADNDAATLVCADRAVTNATIASGFATLNLTFPAEESGYVRDFYLRITVAAGQSAPALSLPQGITIENAGGAVPVIADGEASAAATTLVWFSETAPGVFTAKSETVKAVV